MFCVYVCAMVEQWRERPRDQKQTNLVLSRANQEDKEGARPPAFAASTIAVR
jgi:hypothetical protein